MDEIPNGGLMSQARKEAILNSPDGPYYYYEYDSNVPFDVSEVQRASNTLLEIHTFYQYTLLQKPGRNLVNSTEALTRLRPYLSKSDEDAVNALVEIWHTLKSRFAEETSKEIRNNGDEALPLTYPTLTAKALKPPSKEQEEAQRKSEAEARYQAEQDAAIDEKLYPYSAWSLRESLHTRLIAAARYIDNLKSLGRRVADDPMLKSLRPEAMQMLADGDLRDQMAAETLLEAYKRHVEDLQADAEIKIKGGLMAHLADSQDEFELSEGEEDMDPGSPEAESEIETGKFRKMSLSERSR